MLLGRRCARAGFRKSGARGMLRRRDSPRLRSRGPIEGRHCGAGAPQLTPPGVVHPAPVRSASERTPGTNPKPEPFPAHGDWIEGRVTSEETSYRRDSAFEARLIALEPTEFLWRESVPAGWGNDLAARSAEHRLVVKRRVHALPGRFPASKIKRFVPHPPAASEGRPQLG